MTPAEHYVRAEELLANAALDEMELQARRRSPDAERYAYDAETMRRERELDTLLSIAGLHARLAFADARTAGC